MRPYQCDTLDRVEQAERAGARVVALVAPTGAGKCLGKGTPVLMFDGRIVPVENVRTGDRLMGPDSLPRTVLSTCVGTGSLYRIVPVIGEPWVCNSVHVLTLVETVSGEVVDIPLNAYLTKSKWWRHTHKQFAAEVDFAVDPNPLPVSPYFLGVWLGDGTKNLAGGVKVSKPDAAIRACCEEEASRFGLRLTVRQQQDRCPTYGLSGPRGGSMSNGCRDNPLRAALRKTFDEDFNVSRTYLCGSREVRLDLLAGLLDTDGHCNRGGFDFVQKRRPIADAVTFLARSLGLRATIRQKDVSGYGAYWRVTISGDCSIIPLRIARKKAPRRLQKKNCLRTGFAVEKISDNGDFYGFELDGDGRFLLGDFTVTHNTRMAREWASRRRYGLGCWVAHRGELLEQAIAAFGSGLGSHTQFVSIQSRLDSLPPADWYVIDEAHHHYGSPKWSAAVAIARRGPTLLLTATPEKANGVGVGDLADAMVVAAQPKELIRDGWLVPCDVIAGSAPTRTLTDHPLAAWRKYGEGQKAIVFCRDVKHAGDVAADFVADGVEAVSVDGKISPKLRQSALDRHHSGSLPVLTCVHVLTEGYDDPRVSVGIMARRFSTAGGWIQATGRFVRPSSGKSRATIIDLRGSVFEWGLPDEDRHYSLEGRAIRIGKDIGDPIRQCRRCSRVFRSAEYVDATCPGCGAVCKGKPDPAIRREAMQKVLATHGHDEKKAKFAELSAIAKERGYSHKWVIVQFRLRYNQWPGKDMRQ